MAGAYLTFGILILALLLALAAAVRPMLRKYRVVIRKIEPRKRHAKPKTKKKKSVWIKVI